MLNLLIFIFYFYFLFFNPNPNDGRTHRHTDTQTHTPKKGVRDSGSAKARPGVKEGRIAEAMLYWVPMNIYISATSSNW